MTKKRVARVGAYVLAVSLFGLAAAQAGAADRHLQGHDQPPPSAADRPGTAASVPPDKTTGGAATSDGHRVHNDAGLPAETDGGTPPDAKQGGAPKPDVARQEGRGGPSRGDEVKDASKGAAEKGAPAVNAPTKDSGPIDTPVLVPPEYSNRAPNANRTGKKPFKIATPEKFQIRRLPTAVAPNFGVRNAIGLPVAPQGGTILVPNRATGGTRTVGSIQTLPVPPSVVGGVGRAGLIRAGASSTGIGGPAQTIAGINGTAVRSKR
jgi:hypothetical protein